jgi:hypothetical protein
MRQVYRLLGLARRHGAAETDTACARALEVEVINVGLIERMLTRGLAGTETMARTQPTAPDQPGATDTATTDAGSDAAVVPAASRFVRDPGEFSTRLSTGRPS